MKATLLLIFFILTTAFSVNAQKFLTKTGHIKFYSDAPVEKIEAHNRQVNCALDASTGAFVFKVLLKSFEFEKALMQEHFNENYVESDKYPNATFLGKVINIKDINLAKDGIYDAMVEGKLTLHGVSREIKQQGTFEVKQDKLTGKATFLILLDDYKISIPGAVVKNISKTIEITVDVKLDKTTL